MPNQYFVWGDHSIIFSMNLFGQEIALRYYGVFFALSFIFGYTYMVWLYKNEGKSIVNHDSILNHMLLGTILGARLGHCFFYEPQWFLEHPLEILMIWKGGLASHGGLIGILIALYFYCKKHPEDKYIWLLDRLTVPSVLGACFIRIGNFFNSEIVGIETDVPWAIIFTTPDHGAIPGGIPRHPSMLYEAVSYFIIFAILFLIYRKYKANLPNGLLLGLLLVLIFTVRIIVEFTKTKQEKFESGSFNMGQYLSLPFIAVGICLILSALKSKKKQATE